MALLWMKIIIRKKYEHGLGGSDYRAVCREGLNCEAPISSLLPERDWVLGRSEGAQVCLPHSVIPLTQAKVRPTIIGRMASLIRSKREAPTWTNFMRQDTVSSLVFSGSPVPYLHTSVTCQMREAYPMFFIRNLFTWNLTHFIPEWGVHLSWR